MCYWVEPGRLLAGHYPRNFDDATSPAKIGRLRQSGVEAFIDLTESHELAPYTEWLDGAVHQRFPILDMSVPKTIAFTKSVLDQIDAHLAAGRGTYVHCWGGIGRTGVIIGCWLARRHGGDSAYQRLCELWAVNPLYRRSPETSEQIRYILDWRQGE